MRDLTRSNAKLRGTIGSLAARLSGGSKGEAVQVKNAEIAVSGASKLKLEVTDKLVRKGVPYDMADRIADRLEQDKFIDERRYSRAFIQDKFRFAKWGKQKIGLALRQKRIDPAVYQPLLAGIDTEEYLAVLKALLESKKKSLHIADGYECRAKLTRFALGRGFSADDIRLCIGSVGEDEW